MISIIASFFSFFQNLGANAIATGASPATSVSESFSGSITGIGQRMRAIESYLKGLPFRPTHRDGIPNKGKAYWVRATGIMRMAPSNQNVSLIFSSIH